MNSNSTGVDLALSQVLGWPSPIGDYPLTNGSFAANNYCSSCDVWWWGSHCCTTPQWYPVYWPAPQVDKMQTAFKLVKHLMSKEMVKLDKIEDFVALVDEIASFL